jgi:hypothetical protein
MHRHIAIIGLLFSLKSYSQSIDISKNWLGNIGDTIDWASTFYNDSHWKTIEKISPFERNDFHDFKDFGWVRKKVLIPSTLKGSAEKYGYFYLALGKINDADQTFFNGKLTGQTGSMPPHSIGVDRGQRIYKVNEKDILWDKENQIAVRVFSNFRNGGLWDENFNIIIPSEHIFHAAEKSIPGFSLSKGQRSFEAAAKADISYKEEALKTGGLSLKLNLPEHALVFYNSQYIGNTNSSGEHSFFLPVTFISWNKQDKITVYVDDDNPLEKLLFTTPTFNTIQGNGFNFIQVSNFKIKKGSFENNSPVIVSVEVFNTSNLLFEGDLTLTLTTDINKIQQSLSHPLRLNKMENKKIDFTLLPNFSGVYHVNYILRKNNTGQKITGTLISGEKL